MEIVPSVDAFVKKTQPCAFSPYGQSLSNVVDLKDLYSEEEIKSIISKFPCLNSRLIINKDKYDATYYPDKQVLVLNNRSITNHTVEIDGKGKAISVGSWHHTELNGDYSDIINTTIERYNSKFAIEAQGTASILSSQLDYMARLGQSQVV